jgi:hypothetical protein
MFKTVSQKNLQKPSNTEIYEPSIPATDDAALTSSSSYQHYKGDIQTGMCAINLQYPHFKFVQLSVILSFISLGINFGF